MQPQYFRHNIAATDSISCINKAEVVKYMGRVDSIYKVVNDSIYVNNYAYDSICQVNEYAYDSICQVNDYAYDSICQVNDYANDSI